MNRYHVLILLDDGRERILTDGPVACDEAQRLIRLARQARNVRAVRMVQFGEDLPGLELACAVGAAWPP